MNLFGVNDQIQPLGTSFCLLSLTRKTPQLLGIVREFGGSTVLGLIHCHWPAFKSGTELWHYPLREGL